MENEKVGGFDLLMFQRLWKILIILFPGFCSIPATLFFSLLVISFIEQFIAYNVGLISSEYYKVLGDRDFDGFVTTTLKSTGLVLVMAFVLSAKTYVANILYISWRQILCQALHTLYFSGINYYTLNVLQSKFDNPDQRMTQDIDRLCLSLSTITITVIIAPFQIGYYSYKTYMGTGWVGPTSIYIFFIVGTIINKLLMSPIVKYYIFQEKCEGNFRFKHMHIRTNSESVAFTASGTLELQKTNAGLNVLIDAQQSVFNRKLWLNLMQNLFAYAGSIISYLVIAIPIFNGAYDGLDGADLSSVISKNSFLCMTLMYSLTQLVELAGSTVALSGETHRVSELFEKLQQIQEEWDMQSLQSSESFGSITKNRKLVNGFSPKSNRKCDIDERSEAIIVSRDEDVIEIAYILENVSICAPNTDKVLIKDLSLEIRKDINLLITGPSSCGKSSLLRVLRGLWTPIVGGVAHHLPPGPKGVFFLPQKPLFTNGSLYEQIIYPLKLERNLLTNDEVCSKISEDLDKVHMRGLIDRCGGLLNDPQWNWDDVLSPGEMQRLCFLRLFYHKPKFALLDESTSALSLDVEDILYKRCIELGITIISVGHRSSLMKYHEQLLQIGGDGHWMLEDVGSKDQ